MSALLSSAPLLLRRRSALADLLPVIAFTAATGILATVIGGVIAFADRSASSGGDPMSMESQTLGFLVICAVIAAVLLVPTAIGLGGSAARLSLARREKDLAAMRLVGGTTAQVSIVAIVDVAAQALLGAILGVLVHLAWTPAIGLLDFGMAPFGVSELLLPWWGYVALVAGIAVLAAGSAAIALQGVALTPLGVARGSRTVRMSVVRLLVWGALIIVFIILSQSLQLLGQSGMGIGVIVAIFAIVMALIMGSINVVGPFLVWVAARIVAAVAPSAAWLVGARRLAADPRAGWRAVSGITFALVIAGFLTVMTVFGEASNPDEAFMFTAMHTGGLLTLLISAVLAAVSTGVTQTARVIDQAPVLHAQHVSGAEVSQLHRARLAEIAIPLGLSSIVAVLTAMVLLAPMLSAVVNNPVGPVLQFVGSVLAAYALVVASVLVAAPLVRRGALGRTV